MLAFDRYGSGEPIVLVHGITHRRQIWDAIVPMLADDYEVITVDLLGHGQSPNLPVGLDAIGPIRESLYDFFNNLGLERPTVVGNSLGGMLALQCADDGMAGSAVGIAPARFSNEHLNWQSTRLLFSAAGLAAVALRPVAGLLMRFRSVRVVAFCWLAHHPGDIPPKLAAADARGMARAFTTALRLATHSSWRLEPNIPDSVPVTLAFAEHDWVFWPQQRRNLAAKIPHARAFTLPDVGHVSMYDHPELVAQTIREHMAARPASPNAAAS